VVSGSSQSGITFGGGSTVSYRMIQNATSTLAIAANSNYASTIFGNSVVSLASSGTHAILANVVVKALGTVTNASSRPVTNTAALYVDGASTAGTNNYALWVNGQSRVDGKLIIANDVFNVNTAKTPATSGATGAQGDIAWDASYVYVCTATNTWKRSAITTW
jgi:hypothetical protein